MKMINAQTEGASILCILDIQSWKITI